MHARTTAGGRRPEGAAEPEDDDVLWQALRARAELGTEALVDARPRESAPPEDDWEALLARARMRHAMELRVAGRGFRAPPPLPRSQIPILPQHPLPTRYFAPPAPQPPLPSPASSGFVLPMAALDENLDDPFPLLSSRRQAVGVMLAACVAMGTLSTPFLRHFMSVAEQQAQIERVIHDIQIESARRPASSLTEPLAVQAQAEPPTSETLRAFLKLTAPESPPAVSAPAKRLIQGLTSPTETVVKRTQRPATRPVTTPADEQSLTTARAADETEATPDLKAPSDDPLFGL